jgi:hypothetical protein
MSHGVRNCGYLTGIHDCLHQRLARAYGVAHGLYRYRNPIIPIVGNVFVQVRSLSPWIIIQKYSIRRVRYDPKVIDRYMLNIADVLSGIHDDGPVIKPSGLNISEVFVIERV